ncbi:MAG: hypothetical protein HKO66_07145, partial [Saprospiraceae bacterium]|nr:PKD domain-containing protein [Bacteroidia bacterium]NNL91989.1 hypothetical protein [Saprospiraceae bacterium]
MKKHFNLFILAISAALFFTACEEDLGGGGGIIIPDTISFNLSSEADFVSSDATVNAGETFSVRLIGEKGEDDLQAITVAENGANIPVSQFTVDGNAESANPFLLFGNDLASFTKDVTITSPSSSGLYTYSFTLSDLAGNTEVRSVNITVAATPPSITYMGSGMIMAELGNLVSVPIMAEAGTNLMSEIGVYQNGTAIEAENLFYGELSNQFPTNPALIPDNDMETLDRTIFIRATLPGMNVYTIIITDEGGETASLEVEINGGNMVTMIEGALLNSDGPSGQGGLDLDNGMSVGSSNADA